MKKINEIFYSIQGEGYFTGTPTVFVRFSGCNLRCPFCDTEHKEGKMLSDDDIIAEINRYPALHVVLTGGDLVCRLHMTWLIRSRPLADLFRLRQMELWFHL